MKKLLLSTSAICFAIFSQAQTPDFDWALGTGNTGLDYGWGITVDADGNSYSTGFFEGSVDFDPSAGDSILTSVGGRDCFIQKLDENGALQWAVSFGGPNSDLGYDVALDAENNVYVTGMFGGTVDFDPGIGMFEITDAGESDAFIVKFDSNGNFIWAKNLGGASSEMGLSINIDFDGNVLTSGRFKETVDFDPSADVFDLSSEGDHDVYISKLDSDGNFIWAKSFGGAQFDGSNAITTDHLGNIYTAGYYYDVVDFDPGAGTETTTSNGEFDSFLQKLNSAGEFQWVRTLGSTEVDVIRDLSVDSMGNVLTVGSFEGTVDFNPSGESINLTSAGERDAFVEKIDSDGNLIWVKHLTGVADVIPHTVCTDINGAVYIGGAYVGTADFDPSEAVYSGTAIGINDIFIEKLDANGVFQWAALAGGTQNDLCLAIATYNGEYIYTTGYFATTVDFDPGADVFDINSNGASDAFFMKYSDPTNGMFENELSFVQIFPNPASERVFVNSEFNITNIKITTITGKQIISSKEQSVELSMLNAGVYLISITTDHGIITKRLVKN